MFGHLLLAASGGGHSRRVIGVSVARDVETSNPSQLTVYRASVDGEEDGALAASARRGGDVALMLAHRTYRLSKPIVQLEITTGAGGDSVYGRSGELLMGVAIYLKLARDHLPGTERNAGNQVQAGTTPIADFGATGTLDEDGNVGPVEHVAAKVRAVLSPGLAAGSFVFYPRACRDQIDVGLVGECREQGIELVPVDRIEEVLKRLKVHVEGIWTGNPFLGLAPYTGEHGPVFFGREREVGEVVALLDRRAGAGHPGSLIIGASGAGKSSFCLAGVVPALQQRAPHLECAVWRPRDAAADGSGEEVGEDRMAASMAAAWLRDDERHIGFRLREVPAAPARLAELNDIMAGSPAPLRVLVVDQFEELFTLAFAAEAQKAFARFLKRLQDDGVWVLGTLRSEFYLHYTGLRDREGNALLARVFGQDGRYDLLHMGRAALRRVIAEPARMARLQFEGGESGRASLDERLLADALTTDDTLPLLSFVLDRLYEQRRQETDGDTAARARQPQMLTHAAYDEEGGLRGAIGKRAAEAYAGLDGEAQNALTEVLMALAVPSTDGTRETARPAPLGQWPNGSPARRLIDALNAPDVRVLITEQDGASDDAKVRVAHEALFSHWDEAAIILQDSRQTRLIIEDFRKRADGWSQACRPDGALLSSRQDIENARAVRRSILAGTARDMLHDFVERSIVRERRRKRSLIGSIAAAFLILAAVTTLALIGQRRAEAAERRTAYALREVQEQRGIAADQRDAARSAASSEAAQRKISEQRAREAQLARIAEQRQTQIARQRLAESERQTLLAERASLAERFQRSIAERNARDTRNTLARFFTSNGESALKAGHLNLAVRYSLAGMRIAPDNQEFYEDLLASALTRTGATNAFDILVEDTIPILSVAQRPQSDDLAYATLSGAVRVIDPTGRTMQSLSLSPPPSRVSGGAWRSRDGYVFFQPSVTFAPNGDNLIVSDPARNLVSWSPTIGRSEAINTGHQAIGGSNQSISPDGRKIILSAKNGDYNCHQVWDVLTRRQVGDYIECSGSTVLSAAFSANSDSVITAGHSAIRVWSSHSGQLMRELKIGAKDAVHYMSISPDGNRLAVAIRDGTAMIVDLTTGKRIGPIMQVGRTASAIAFSHDGSRVVTGSGGDVYAVQVWNAATGMAIGAPLLGHSDWISSVMFSKDNRRVISASEDGTIRSWTLDRPDEYRPPSLANRFNRLTVDNKLLIQRSGPGSLRYDSGCGPINFHGLIPSHPVLEYTLNEYNTSLAVSSDCKLALIAYEGGADVFDLESNQKVAQLYPPEGRPITAFFSRDLSHAFILTEYYSEKITNQKSNFTRTGTTWEVKTGKQIGEPIRFPVFTPKLIRLSPDGTFLLEFNSGGYEQASHFQVWSTVTGRPVGKPVHMPSSPGNGAEFSPEGNVVVTTHWNGTAKIWDWQSGKQIGATLVGHTDRVERAMFSPDGAHIATASGDGEVRIWNARNGTPTGIVLRVSDQVVSFHYSRDGRRLITASGDNTAQVWNPLTGAKVGAPIHEEGYDFNAFLDTERNDIVTVVRESDQSIVWRRYKGGYRLARWSELADVACRRILRARMQNFSNHEIANDPLLIKLWPSSKRSVCD